MRLIIGGCFQGKAAYGRDTYQIADLWEGGYPITRKVDGIHHLERVIKEAPMEPEALAQWLLREYKDGVLICQEVGYGIVPMDKEEARYREKVGRTMCLLAAEAESMERVIAGIPQRIK